MLINKSTELVPFHLEATGTRSVCVLVAVKLIYFFLRFNILSSFPLSWFSYPVRTSAMLARHEALNLRWRLTMCNNRSLLDFFALILLGWFEKSLLQILASMNIRIYDLFKPAIKMLLLNHKYHPNATTLLLSLRTSPSFLYTHAYSHKLFVEHSILFSSCHPPNVSQPNLSPVQFIVWNCVCVCVVRSDCITFHFFSPLPSPFPSAHACHDDTVVCCIIGVLPGLDWW